MSMKLITNISRNTNEKEIRVETEKERKADIVVE